MTVVAVHPGDPAFPRVVALFDEYRVHYGRQPAPDSVHDWLRTQLTDGRLGVAAALGGDHACGFVTTAVLPASLLLGTFWQIRDLYVAPPCRRAGVARRLLQYVVTQARGAGAVRVSLQTEAENAAALELYAGMGFEPVIGLRGLSLGLG